MPVPEIESLDPSSQETQVKAAISACIATEIRAGRPRNQAIAMCHEMMRKRTGGEAPPGGLEGGSV